MTLLPHLAARLFGVPLAIHRPKLDVILAVLGPRIGLADLAAPSSFMPPVRPAATQTTKVAVIPSTAPWFAAPWAWKPNLA